MKIAQLFTDNEGLNVELQAESEAERALLRLVEDNESTCSFDDTDDTLIVVLPVYARERA